MTPFEELITTNRALTEWVSAIAAHTRPSRVHWCDGSEEERTALENAMVSDGTLVALDETLHPRSFLHRSAPSDVARTEHLTFICTADQADVGPTNNWMSRAEADARVWSLFRGAMRERTMYVVPYLMGPAGSRFSRVGIEITDSPYVTLSLRIMTRMGRVALEHLGPATPFVRGVHSLGDLAPERRFVVHFPDTREIWSIGSGYGGNALLSKKCHALRIASIEARSEGWLAEHMLILGLTSPTGKRHFVVAAFPSACGKTNLAMLVPTLPGWQVDTVGDDICWLHRGADGGLRAINPEHGMFGVAPGTSHETNPNALRSLTRDCIFTNVALRSRRRPWWEGLCQLDDGEVLEDWRRVSWTARDARSPAAHPNARFTAALSQCPTARGTFDEPAGVPVSAIIFGGRRSDLAPLVYQARDWKHGVYVGATMASETTAAATGAVGVLRHDPMAMVPFCGYNMGDYFRHWLSLGETLTSPPAIFHVNWFRRGPDGKMLWPGYGENIRVLEWILRRVERTAPARETVLGSMPTRDGLDTAGLNLPPDAIDRLFHVDEAAWADEARRSMEFLAQFGDRVPEALKREHEAFTRRLLMSSRAGVGA